MELLLFKTLWGHQEGYDAAARQAVSAGFQGLEARVPEALHDIDDLLRALDDHGLQYIGEVVTGGNYVPDPTATPAEHLRAIEQALPQAHTLGARFVNCIAGYDAWTVDVSMDLFARAMGLGERHGVQLSFETHRSRSLFNPWLTLQIIERLPELRLTCDYSHWCVVCERLLDSEAEVLAAVAQRAQHIHARVGYEQGPQVPHPAAPEYAEALAAHQRWWAQIWNAQRACGAQCTTMTPEFGPDGYLHTLPFTGAPVADPWQINRWMAQMERAHFQSLYPDVVPVADVRP